MALALSAVGQAAVAEAVRAVLFDGGTLALYPAPRPATADDPPAGPVLCRLVVGEVATGIAKGRAVWFRCTNAAGQPLCDGSIGTSVGYDLTASTTEILVGTPVTVQAVDLTLIVRPAV